MAKETSKTEELFDDHVDDHVDKEIEECFSKEAEMFLCVCWCWFR